MHDPFGSKRQLNITGDTGNSDDAIGETQRRTRYDTHLHQAAQRQNILLTSGALQGRFKVSAVTLESSKLPVVQQALGALCFVTDGP